MEKEEWKDIPGYEGLYQVSDLGRVYSLPKTGTGGHNGKIMKQAVNRTGYLKLNIQKDGVKEFFEVHQLVAMAFLGHVRCGHTVVVDHINNIKTDNRVVNLQLITPRENSTKDKVGIYSSKFTGVYWHKINKKWRSKISINNKRVFLGEFDDELEAAKAYQDALAYEKYKDYIL